MNQKIASELVDMAERIAQEAVDVYLIPAFGLVMGQYSIVYVRKGQSPRTDRRTQGEPEYLGTAPSLEDAEDAVAGVGNRPGGPDKIKKALKRLKASDMSERVAASETLVDFAGDDEELTEFLADYLDNFIRGSSFVGRNAILFYEEETRKGESVQVEITVNPRNQPKKTGKVIVGLFIEDTAESRAGTTYEDGMWSFDITDSVREVAKTIGQAAQKILKKF